MAGKVEVWLVVIISEGEKMLVGKVIGKRHSNRGIREEEEKKVARDEWSMVKRRKAKWARL